MRKTDVSDKRTLNVRINQLLLYLIRPQIPIHVTSSIVVHRMILNEIEVVHPIHKSHKHTCICAIEVITLSIKAWPERQIARIQTANTVAL